MKEADLHKAVVDFLALTLPKDATFTTFPAGGGGYVRGAMLKRAGLAPGWPDIQIIYDGKYHGIELKREGGRVSPSQKACHEQIEHAGASVAVCRSIDDINQSLLEWGIPRRVEVA